MTDIKTVLIVDDAPGIHHIIKNYLGPEYDILQATTGEAALQLAKSHRINLVVLDVMLPGSIMGNDILQALRKRRATADIPVIMISGLPAYQDSLESLDKNIIFLPKPFTKEQFLEQVENSLGATYATS